MGKTRRNKGDRRKPVQTITHAERRQLLSERQSLQRTMEELLFAGHRKVPGRVSEKVRSLTQEEIAAIYSIQSKIRDLDWRIRN